MPGPGIELRRQLVHADLQALRARLRFGDLLRRGDELLVGHGECHEVGNAPRDDDIFLAERVRPFRPEGHADHLAVRGGGHPEHRTIAGGHQPRLKVRRVQERHPLFSHVGHEVKSVRGRGRRLGEPKDAAKLRKIARRGGLGRDLAVAAVKCHRQRIVCEHLVGNLRDLRKHGADIQHAANRAQQFHGRVDVGDPLALNGGQARGFREPLMGERDRDEVGEELGERQILFREGIDIARQQRQDADRRPVDADGNSKPRLESRDVAGVPEQRRPRRVAGRVVLTRAEQSRRAVVLRAREQPELRAVLREQREGGFVVRNDSCRDATHLPEHGPDVEGSAQSPQQVLERVQPIGLEIDRQHDLGGHRRVGRRHHRALSRFMPVDATRPGTRRRRGVSRAGSSSASSRMTR